MDEYVNTKPIIKEMDNVLKKESNLKVKCKKNHSDYFDLNILFVKNLPEKYLSFTKEIIKLYNSIDSLELLNDNYEECNIHYKVINSIKNKIEKIKYKTNKELIEIIKNNDEKEKNLDLTILDDIDSELELSRKIIDEKLSSLKLFNTTTNFTDYKIEMERQNKRTEYISEINVLIKKYKNDKNNIHYKSEIISMNDEIKEKIKSYLDKINEIRKNIEKDEKKLEYFDKFISSIQDMLIYDDSSYDDVLLEFKKIVQSKTMDNKLNELLNKI